MSGQLGTVLPGGIVPARSGQLYKAVNMENAHKPDLHTIQSMPGYRLLFSSLPLVRPIDGL